MSGCPNRCSPTRPTRRRASPTPTRCRCRSCCCSSGSRRSSEPCSCCTTSSATTTARWRRSSTDRRTTAARSACGHAGTSPSTRRGSNRPARSATSWRSRFLAAFTEGDVDGLVALLAADVVVQGDSGGHSPSWPNAIVGREKVARLLVGLANDMRRMGITLRPTDGERAARSDRAQRRRRPDQRVQRRHRRRPGANPAFGDQSRQTSSPWPARRSAGAAAASAANTRPEHWRGRKTEVKS